MNASGGEKDFYAYMEVGSNTLRSLRSASMRSSMFNSVVLNVVSVHHSMVHAIVCEMAPQRRALTS